MRVLVIMLLLLSARPASAYWAKNHRALNEQIACDGRPWEEAGFKRAGQPVKTVEDYARLVLYVAGPGTCPDVAAGQPLRGVPYDTSYPPGFDKPTDAPSGPAHTLLDWNSWGGLWEDGFESMDDATQWGGRRAVNHFHDPLTGSGAYTGITDSTGGAIVPLGCLLRRGTSVTSWVQNGDGADVGEKNLWGYPTIGDCLHRAYTELPDEKREAGLACAFRALGQVEHLIEDNTVPDHTRDLAHPGNGWEEYLKDSRADLFRTAPKPWTVFPLKLIERGGLRAVWDRDVYNGANPEITWTSGFDPPGLSEYVNANFYAWNYFTQLVVPYTFTTIPDEPGQGFKRGWRIRPVGAGVPVPGLPLLSVRRNEADYPFPKWNDDGSTLLPAQAGSLPQRVAHRVPESTTLDETADVWKDWEAPLLKHALGYAQTAVALALPPARMEVVPSPDGDPLKLTVRLWNLWPTGSPHAVTWHVDELKLVIARPGKDKTVPFADEAPISVPGTFDLAPGQVHESDAVTLTWAQRGAMRYASHMALLVKAHLGSGNTQTPLVFSVLVPNAVVWVKQTGAVDVTPPFTNVTQNCSTGSCAYSGENGVYRNPSHQRVTGRIELAAAEVDSVGRPADDQLKAVQKRDARVAGVALVGFSRESTLEVLHASQSTLALTGSKLIVGSQPGVYVRGPQAADEADGPIDFEVDLQLNDFYRPDLSQPQADATRTSGTIYLAVWTTAGAVQLQRLIVWPWLHPGTAQAAIAPDACNVTDVPHTIFLNESRGICTHDAMMSNPCSNYTHHAKRVEVAFADPGWAQQRAVENSVTDFIMAFGNSTDVRPVTFAGRNVPLSGTAQLPTTCNISALSMTWPDGNGEVLCAGFAPTGLALFYAENDNSAGQCSGTPQPPSLPRTAEYKHVIIQDALQWMNRGLGITNFPEWTFSLSAQ